MATYKADVITTSAPAKHGLETVTAVGKITVGTALVAADIVQFVKIPAGAVVTEVKASCSGSLGSTLTAEFGDGDDTDRYIASATFGQGAASFANLNKHTGLAFNETAEDTLDMKVNTAASGTTGEVITVVVQYHIP